MNIRKINRENGEAYTWLSSYSAGANDDVIYIRNDDESYGLVIDSVILNSSVDNKFIFADANGDPTGTELAAQTMNKAITGKALYTAKQNASAVSRAEDFQTIKVISKESFSYTFPTGYIMGKNNAISIRVTVAADIEVSVLGAFE